MNRIALLAAGCAVLALAACDHPDAARQRAERALQVVSKLDCPETQGQLTRVSATADSCVYSADGAEVVLKLVKLNGAEPAKALAPIEAELKALMPQADKPAEPAAITADGEDVSIKLPGINIEAKGDGTAKVDVAGAQINADDEGAEVRVERNVRVDGKTVESASHRRRRGSDEVMARFILASDTTTGEWSVVGYEARGPKGGPLVVGTLKAKDGQDGENHDLFEDISDLIRHNVGGREHKGFVITAD